jgi:hypothetical protein
MDAKKNRCGAYPFIRCTNNLRSNNATKENKLITVVEETDVGNMEDVT